MEAIELYHFPRLREDEHAQWDIRSIAGSMMKILRGKFPVLFLLTCGKHEFKKKYMEIYSPWSRMESLKLFLGNGVYLNVFLNKED